MFLDGLKLRMLLAIGALILVLIARAGAGILTSFFNSRQESVHNEIGALAPKWSSKLEDNILQLPSRVEEVRTLLNNHIYGSKLFDFLRANTSKQVVIDSVNIDTKNLSLDIKARAASYDVLAGQIVWLKSLPAIESLKVSGIALSEKGLVDFSLSIKLSPSFFKNT